MDKTTFKNSGLIEQYILGLTTPEEARMVEQFAARHPEIQTELEALQEAMEEYAARYVSAPPPELRDQVIHLASSPAAVRSQLWGRVTAALALIFALSTGLLLLDRQNQQNSYQELHEMHEDLERTCAEIRTNCRQSAMYQAFLEHPATHPVPLQGTPLAPEARVVVFWNDEAKKAYLLVDLLPTAPQGHTYQLWADVDGKMINAGIFDCHSKSMQVVQFVERAESLNVTLEPIGGSQHPTVELLTANGPV
jgi:anti-sigma-K factor RskA